MDLFAEFMKLVVRLSVGIGGLIGAAIHAVIKSAAEGSTRLPAPTKAQKKELDENQRLAGCREVVLEAIRKVNLTVKSYQRRRFRHPTEQQGC